MKLDHLVLLCSNLADSAPHYDTILPRLGFEKTRDWVWANSEGVAIDLRLAKDGFDYQRYAPGLNHLAFAANSKNELDAIIADLTNAGLTLPAVQTFEDGLAVFIPDPDGLRIEIGWEQPTG